MPNHVLYSYKQMPIDSAYNTHIMSIRGEYSTHKVETPILMNGPQNEKVVKGSVFFTFHF